MRYDLEIVKSWIPNDCRVLDLGCGEGALLASLRDKFGVHGYGVEIESKNVIHCIENKVNVLQVDIDSGLQVFADHSFEVAVLSQTIQAINKTESTLREMLRVANQAIVTIPNFGYWSMRLQLMLGKMPNHKTLPYQWFNTPNVRYCTIADFNSLCGALDISILDCVAINDDGKKIKKMQNLFASLAIYKLGRGSSQQELKND